jgi:propanediol dehydratase small subunit
MSRETIRTASGRTLNELTMEAVLAGRLKTDDFCISAETLRRQADAAEAAGYGQLAENLRRAAELTRISNDEVLRIYDKLRPGRATYEELVALADHLEREFRAPLIADLVREAAEVYRERDLVTIDETQGWQTATESPEQRST